jgi:molecular chaperone GrpE
MDADRTTNESLEQVEADPAEEGNADEVEHDLDALLADVKRERDEYLELAQRARADFENYRTRELLPALDNLERALRAAGLDPESGRPARGPEPTPEEEDAEAFDVPSEEVSAQEALARGVALVYGELRAALERAGVETYDPAGEPFDPATSEALATRPAGDGVPSGVVIETLERGYRLDGQVLRAARVVVSE